MTIWVEERIYTLAPGVLQEYFRLYEEFGLQIQRKYIPRMLGYYSSEIGDLNEVVHLWAHLSLDAREDARQRMRVDPNFKAYWGRVRPLIQRQRNRILRPAPFFEQHLARMLEVA